MTQELENLKIQLAQAEKERDAAIEKANALRMKIYNIEIDTVYRRELMRR